MAQPTWITPAGDIGTIPANVFYAQQLLATDDVDHNTVYFKIISGVLPQGVICSSSGVLSGVPTRSVSTTYKFAVRAYTERVIGAVTVVDHIIDRTFTLTVTGDLPPEFITPAGLIADFFTGDYVYTGVPGSTQKIRGLQIEYTQFDACTVSLVAGELPPQIAISDKGLLTGFFFPLNNLIWYNEFEFTLEVTNGKYSALRTYILGVYNRALLTADNTWITTDTTLFTADMSSDLAPVITTLPRSLDTVRVGDYFAFKFDAFDVQGDRYQFGLVESPPITFDQYPPYKFDQFLCNYDQGILTIPPDLTLDPNSGWLYGRIAPTGVSSITFDFGVRAYKYRDPLLAGESEGFSITVVDALLSSVTWLYPSDLGSIANGNISTFAVTAVASNGTQLYYRLYPGSASRLPQGLALLANGYIVGRTSFQTFCLDGGTTTFDVTPVNGVSDPTTFDLKCTFTVEAYSQDGSISVTKEFTINIIREYNDPYENLYIQAMPPPSSRLLIQSLLSDTAIFPDERIYRPGDPYFGVAVDLTYWHCYGIPTSSLEQYIAALQYNHYNKQLTIGSLKTARALDDSGNTIYEVVYAEIIDDLVNNAGVSIGHETILPYPLPPTNSTVVYPNSLVAMRNQILNSLGQESNILPRWMLSTQADGTVLGFTPAWVIAYTNPGQSGRVQYDITQAFGSSLNLIDFTADRYEIDRQLTRFWDPALGTWEPTPEVTTFDRYAWTPVLTYRMTIDYGTTMAYYNINNRTEAYINSLGGVDGVQPLDGRLLVFVRQQNFPGLGDNTAWTDTSVMPNRVIPGQFSGGVNERMGIYLCEVDSGGIVHLTLVTVPVTNNYVVIKSGDSYNNTPVYYPPGPAAGLTVVNWQPLPVPFSTPTVFDGGNTGFLDPTTVYDAVINTYDKYVLFPKTNILEDKPRN